MPTVVSRRVISLESSDRLDSFFAQPQAHGFQVFAATDGRAEDCSLWLDAEAVERRSGATLTPGQKGCASSHWRLWKEFADSRGPDSDLMLISEDDTEFLPGSTAVVDRIAAKSDGFDLLILSDTWSRLGRPELELALMASAQPSPLGSWFRVEGELYRFGRFAGVPWSAGFYLISRRGARKLTSAAERSAWVADDWHYLREHLEADIGILRPSAVVSDGDSMTRMESSKAKDATNRSESLIKRIAGRTGIRSRMRAAKLLVAAGVFDIQWRRNLSEPLNVPGPQ